MNMHHRSALYVRIARPAPIEDGLHSLREGFAAPHQTLSARISPRSGKVSLQANGLTVKEGLLLLLPPCADIAPADGVWLNDESAPAFRCVRVQRYPLHTEALLERRAI